MKSVVMLLLVVAMVYSMVKPGVALNCSTVYVSLESCLPYLLFGGKPSVACCKGVKNPVEITPTTEERRAACECLKAAAAKYPNINQDAASSLPEKREVPLNIPVSEKTNCADIQ